MSEPVHAVVSQGAVIDVIVIDVETVALFIELGFVEDIWPGATLVDVTGADPRPRIGWTYDGSTFTPPALEPDPEPTPEPPSDELAG